METLTHVQCSVTGVPPALLWAKHTLEYLIQAAEDAHLPCYILQDCDLFEKDRPGFHSDRVQFLFDVVQAVIAEYKYDGSSNEC